MFSKNRYFKRLLSIGLILLFAACNSIPLPEVEPVSESISETTESEIEKDSDAGQKSISFIAGQDMKSRRDRFGLLVLSDGKLIASGGRFEAEHYGGGDFNKTAEVFDPNIGEWVFTGEMTEGRLTPALFELPNGNVMVAGGLSGQRDPLISTEIWDPKIGIWESGPEMNRAHNQMGTVTLNDGRLLVVGGATKDEDGFQVSLSKETEILDLESGIWTDVAPMATKRANHSALVLLNGNVLVIGGGKQDGPYFKTTEIYDPETDTWKSGASMSKGRVAHTATLLSDGKVLVVGGKGKITVAEIYNPDTDTWSPAGETNKPRGEHSALLLTDGSVLVTGGIGYISEVEIFDPKTSTWSIVGSLNTGRYRHAVTQLNDGRVLIMAGTAEEGMLATVEIYQD